MKTKYIGPSLPNLPNGSIGEWMATWPDGSMLVKFGDRNFIFGPHECEKVLDGENE